MDFSKINKEINQFGLSVIALEATDYLPSYAHSIGLGEQYQHPEIIIFGLPVTMMQGILNEIGSIIKGGERIETGKSYDQFFENGLATFVTVDERNLGDYFGYAIDYYQKTTFSAIQLVWTDRNYKFPWDEGFEAEFTFKQALLHLNADFKFLEEKHLIVRSSKNKNKPMSKVTHDADGQWSFYTDTSEGDLIESTLAELVLQDPSLNSLFDLDYGQVAERKTIEEKWIRSWM
jgi:hypothetical protein